MKIENISKSFGGKRVLSDFSLSIPENEMTVITGQSGCGKTTLLRIIADLEKADGGTVSDAGRISFLFQEDRLFAHLTALQNVQTVLGKSERGKAAQMLSYLKLADALNKYPRELSGGMKRRTAIARALAFDADTYIFDEPMKGLDLALKEETAAVMAKMTAGKTVIVVTHEPELFAKFAVKTVNL